VSSCGGPAAFHAAEAQVGTRSLPRHVK
jgi:hypothetical protein